MRIASARSALAWARVSRGLRMGLRGGCGRKEDGGKGKQFMTTSIKTVGVALIGTSFLDLIELGLAQELRHLCCETTVQI